MNELNELRRQLGLAFDKKEEADVCFDYFLDYLSDKKEFLLSCRRADEVSKPADLRQIRQAFKKALAVLRVATPFEGIQIWCFSAARFYWATNSQPSPVVTWIYFDDLKKGAVCATTETDSHISLFSLQANWMVA